MGRCLTITFVLSGVAIAGLAYFLYTPLPPNMGNFWNLQLLFLKMKVSFIYGGVYTLVAEDKMAGVRTALSFALGADARDEDRAALEIYDTKLNNVPVRIYKPKDVKGDQPGLVFLHGGGWILLDVPSYDGLCAYIANKANIVVISVEYRLAPENPFPIPFNDCLDVVRYTLQHGGKLGLDTNRIAVGGDSAGGNLGAAVAMKLRDEKIKPPLKAQILVYGLYQFCDLTLPGIKAREAYAKGDLKMAAMFFGYYVNFTKNQIAMIAENKYLTSGLQRKCDRLVDYKLLPKELVPANHVRPDRLATEVNDEVKKLNLLLDDTRLAPLMAENLQGLPSTFSVAVFWDFLRDENLIYAERLKTAGNKVKVVYLSDSFHGILNKFDYDRYGFDAGKLLINEMLAFIETELK